MTAHIQSANLHPIMDLGRELQINISDFAAALQAPFNKAVKEGEDELAAAIAKVSELEAELTVLRRDLILENIPRSKLTKIRKDLAVARDLKSDLETGLAAAYRHLGQPEGRPLVTEGSHAMIAITAIRDTRGRILGDREMDRQVPVWMMDNAKAMINSLIGKLDTVARFVEEHKQADGAAVTATVKKIRRQCGLITNEIEMYSSRANAPAKAAA